MTLRQKWGRKVQRIHRRIRYVKTWDRGRVNDFDQFEQ